MTAVQALQEAVQYSAIIHTKYLMTRAGVDETLKTLMGTNLKLSDLHTSVVIPSYELESSSPFTFWYKHSASAEESQTGFVAMLRADDVAGLDATSMVGGVQFVKGRDFKLWEVARASSAAPTYFPGKLGSSAEHAGAVDMTHASALTCLASPTQSD